VLPFPHQEVAQNHQYLLPQLGQQKTTKKRKETYQTPFASQKHLQPKINKYFHFIYK
jgi:hypothetical protein